MYALRDIYNSRLMDLACELARKYGLDLPPGLKDWEAKRRQQKEQLEPTLAEKSQEEATGITPEQRCKEITEAYEASDTAEAFRAALEEKGYVLARGDKRGLVVVDRFGDVHSLTRYLKGHKAGAVKKKLAPLMLDQLPTVDQAKEQVRQHEQAKHDAQSEREKKQQGLSAEAEKVRDAALEKLRKQMEEWRREKQDLLAEKQASRRLELQQAEQQLLTRQQAETLALHGAQASESRGLLFRVRSAVARLIERTPGLRSVLSHIQKLTHLDPKERHRLESEALSRRHAREKLDVERLRRTAARLDTRERRSFEKALRRQQRLHEAALLEIERAAGQARSVDNQAMQDFYEAARDQGLWREREFKEGELRENFNDAAEFAQGADDSGEDDDRYAPDWNDSADDGDDNDDGPKFRRRRGKGYGYRRDSD